MAKQFDKLAPPLSSESLQCIEECFHFTFMTPVQAATIPQFLTNKDVCVQATTGSGKTLAFGIPIFEILKRQRSKEVFNKKDVGGLVLAPTRELATQIHDVLSQFSKYFTSIHCGLFVGGTTTDATDYEEHGVQIMIGTPGRVLDMKNKFNWKKLEILILDEADRMLEDGFKDTMDQILGMLPKQRRTGLFSATPTEVKELTRAGLRNPVSICVKVQNNNNMGSNTTKIESNVQATPSSLENWFMVAEHEERPSQLAKFLCNLNDQCKGNVDDNDKLCKVIIFCSTCACVDFYYMVFEELIKQKCKHLPVDMNVVACHGKMDQKKRNILFKKFQVLSKGLCVMFSSDLNARGVDIPNVDWVIQLAAPKDPAFFIHRVGRTGRAGKKGSSLYFVSPAELPYIQLLRGRNVPLFEKQKLDVGDVNSEDSILAKMKKLATRDRDVMVLGSTAFMSYLKAYQNNLCSYIFRLDQLDIGGLARSYALLKLPKIPETRGKKGRPIIFHNTNVDTSKIAFKNREKEQARLRRLAAGLEEQEKAEQLQAELIAAEYGHTVGDGDDDDNSDKAIDERTLKSIKSIATSRRQKQPELWLPEEEYKAIDDQKRKRKKKVSVQQQIFDEWDELAAEEMAYKKFKKGKMSKAEYDDCLTSEKVLSVDPLTGESVVEGGIVKKTTELNVSEDDDSSVAEPQPKKKVKFNKNDSDSDMSDLDSDLDDDSDAEAAPKLSRKERKLKNKPLLAAQAAAKKQQAVVSSNASVKSYSSFKSAHSAGSKIDYRNRGPRGNLYQRTKNLNNGNNSRKR